MASHDLLIHSLIHLASSASSSTMGNVLSEEADDPSFLEQGFNLESPEADKKINYGTAAPNWQNKKEESDEDDEVDEHGQEVAMPPSSSRDQPASSSTSSSNGTNSNNNSYSNSNNNSSSSASNSNGPLSAKHRRDSNVSDSSADERRKRQHKEQQLQQQQQQQLQQKKLSYIQMAKLGYQELVNAIIRPPRAEYKMESLGPPAFNFCGKRFTRTDFTLRTKRGFNLECSHWEPVERATDRIPVVIYMHGNSSARIEVIPQLSYLLSLGLAVFAFDFAGSGKSDGEYVSLGYFEREDLSCIVAHLRATTVVSTIALWGRSMGAATALMFGDRDPSIACMILDSPFADLTQLCEEMVEKGREQGIIVPNFVVSVAIRMIQGSVKKQAGFNIRSISPIAHADKCFIPALFVAGEHDDFIKKHHSEQIYEKYAGDKNLIVVEGDHNSPRPKFMFDSASIFLQTCLQIPNSWALHVPISMNLMCPPWYFEIYQQRAAQRRQPQQPPGVLASSAASSNGNATTSERKSEAAANGFNHEEVGMTTERQRVIQASLFKMLGQADGPETSDATTTSKEGKTTDDPSP